MVDYLSFFFLVGPQVCIYFEFCYIFFSSFSKVKKRKESFRLVFEFDAKATFHFLRCFRFQNNAQSDWMGGGFVECVFYYWVQNDENLFLKKLNSFSFPSFSYQPNGALARFMLITSSLVFFFF